MPSRIAFLFAVPDELRPLARLVSGAQPLVIGGRRAVCGRLHQREALLLPGGMGARCAERATRAILDEWRPEALIIAGVAGALSPDLQRGDVLCAREVYSNGEVLSPTLSLNGLRSAPC